MTRKIHLRRRCKALYEPHEERLFGGDMDGLGVEGGRVDSVVDGRRARGRGTSVSLECDVGESGGVGIVIVIEGSEPDRNTIVGGRYTLSDPHSCRWAVAPIAPHLAHRDPEPLWSCYDLMRGIEEDWGHCLLRIMGIDSCVALDRIVDG
jgi:hypothetical protein